jgi:CheY-like chemotaxis protein
MDQHLVLIVEDDAAVAASLEKLARRAGFITAVDADGKSAHTLARNLKPCCVLLDIGQPAQDGRDILAELKSDPDTRDIPVVMSSSREDPVTPPDPLFFVRLARQLIAGRPQTELGRYLTQTARVLDHEGVTVAVEQFMAHQN